MKTFTLLSFLSIAFLFSSCDEDKTEPDGLCSQPQKFDKQDVKFAAKGGKQTLKAKDDWWWMEDYIHIEGEVIGLYDNPDFEVERGKIKGWDNPNVIYDEGADEEIKKIGGEWFTITKDTYSTLTIVAKANDSSLPRMLTLGVQAGNCFYAITVSQSAD